MSSSPRWPAWRSSGWRLFFGLRDRFAAPHGPDEVKNDGGDKGGPADEPDDPSLYKPAPVSLAAGVPAKAAIQRRRAAVLRGRVLTPDRQGVEKVVVKAPGQSQAGQALDRRGRRL